MQHQAQTTPATKSGISPTSTKTEPVKSERHHASPEQLDRFLDSVAQPDTLEKDKYKFPYVEVPRVVIEHYLKGKALENFDKPEVGFFTFQGVSVYEEGKCPHAKELA